MKKLLLCLLIATGGYQFITKHGVHSRSYYASRAMPEPSPVLSEIEVADDMPAEDQFAAATWVPASEDDALVFAESGEDTHCSDAWRDAVRGADSGWYFEKTSLMGRRGVCEWHKMRLMMKGGLMRSAFTRPGPRRTGQTGT